MVEIEDHGVAVSDAEPFLSVVASFMRVEVLEPERAMSARSEDGAWVWSLTLARTMARPASSAATEPWSETLEAAQPNDPGDRNDG